MMDLEEPEAIRNQGSADGPREDAVSLPPELPLSQPDPGPDAADHALAVLRIPFQSFWQLEPAVRRGIDPDAVHDMRVATRRMRAAISLFREHLPERAQAIREDLRWIAGALGAVRDLDVQSAQIRRWSGRRLSGGAEGARSVLSLLERRRQEARVALLAALDSERYRAVVADLSSMLDPSTAVADPARAPLTRIAPPLVSRRMKSVRKAARRVSRSGRPEDYHELRIRCKRLRYTLEFLSTLYGRPAERMIRALVWIQDILGEHQDAQTGIEQMHRIADAEGGVLLPRTLLTIGEIVGCYRRQADRRRAALPKAMRRIRGARWRALKKAMQPSPALAALPAAGNGADPPASEV